MVRAAASVAYLLLAAGCAAPVVATVQTGPDTYSVRGHTGTFVLVEVGRHRLTAEEKAYRYCGGMNRDVRVVSADARRTTTTHGHFSTVTFEFRCVPRAPANAPG